jgi:hypothetical protein
MTTLQPLTLSLFEDELPSCQEDSPVRTFRRQAKAQDYRANVQDYGSPCLTLFGESDPGLSWLRTWLPSIVEALTPFCAGWKKRATPQNRSWWQLQTWERRTDASESLSSLNDESSLNWITPTAVQIQRSDMEKRTAYRASIGRKYLAGTLEEQLQNWATPASADAVGSHGGSTRQGRSLRTDIYNLKHRTSVCERTEFPTPRANKVGGYSSPGYAPTLQQVIQGVLNPSWVENLMGFPQGWTDVSDSPPAPAKNSTNGKRRERSPVSCLTVPND